MAVQNDFTDPTFSKDIVSSFQNQFDDLLQHSISFLKQIFLSCLFWIIFAFVLFHLIFWPSGIICTLCTYGPGQKAKAAFMILPAYIVNLILDTIQMYGFDIREKLFQWFCNNPATDALLMKATPPDQDSDPEEESLQLYTFTAS